MSYLGEVTARALSKVSPAYKRRTPLLYAPHTEDILHLIRTGKADVGVFSEFLMTPRIVRLLEKYGFEAPVPPMCRTTGSHSPMPSSR